MYLQMSLKFKAEIAWVKSQDIKLKVREEEHFKWRAEELLWLK